MRKILKFSFFCLIILFFNFLVLSPNVSAYAYDNIDEDYYTIYDSYSNDVLFIRGDGVFVSDEYISSDNKLYIISEIDENNHTGKAIYKENVSMPVISVKKRNEGSAYAASSKIVAMYHTHNDECYVPTDGTDSLYGKGGIHDVGKKLKSDLENLGIRVAYSENLHLPHNSSAYTRSEVTVSELIRDNEPDAIFDIHRDATPKSEYLTTVNGEKMSKVRMVVGSANQNFDINKEFALTIKAYADEVYPGLIKDIYIGKGNYNQQLSERAMLFEMGCHNIEKDLVYKSCDPLAKTVDMVLYGVHAASSETLSDVDIDSLNISTNQDNILNTGLVNRNITSVSSSSGSNTLYVVLGVIGGFIIITILLYVFVPKIREKVNRFFSELTAGMFKRRKNVDN